MDLKVIISNSVPDFVAKPVNFILTNVVGRVLTLVQNISNTMVNFSQFVSQKFVEISDKLTAIFGEIKAALNEKVSKFVANTKKKLKWLFFISEDFDVDDDEKKIEEAKRTFELKTFIHSFVKTFKKEKDGKDNEY
jgi:hypothetical protein